MSDTINSPNMGLPVPIVGTDPGPQYATDVNSCFAVVDSHDHSTGHGVPITPAGMNISSDLSIGSNNLTNIRSVRLSVNSGPLALAADLGCLYESGVDLYFNDGNGNQIQITQDGGIAGTPGSIANLTPPASASYVSANQTFVFQSAALTSANIDGASFILRNLTASSNALTLQPPSSISSNYSITLPSLPATSAPLIIGTGGVITAVTALMNAFVPSGSIISYGGTSAPAGFLVCDGSAVSRSTYSSLFSAISINYGYGDQTTTFNLPDLRGRFLRGVDSGAGNDPNASSRTAINTGGNTGDNVGSLQADAIVSHSHVARGSDGGVAADNHIQFGTDNGNQFFSSTDTTGGSETRPKNVYVTFIIKT